VSRKRIEKIASSLTRDRFDWWALEEAERKALADKRQEQKGIQLTTSCEGRVIPGLWGVGFVSGNVILLPEELLTEASSRWKAPVMIALTSTERLTGYYGIWHNGIRVSPGGGIVFEELSTGAQTTPWTFLSSGITTEYSEEYMMPDVPPNYSQEVSFSASFVANVSVHWFNGELLGQFQWQALTFSSDYTVSGGTYTITSAAARAKRVRFRYTANAAPSGGKYALAYHGTSYVAHSALDVGPTDQQAKLGDWKFLLASNWTLLPEVDQEFSPDGGDYLVPVIVKDILTGYAFGQSCDWPLAKFDDVSWQAWKQMCGAHSLYGSLVLTEQRDAAEIIGELTDSTNTAMLWSEGKLKFVCLDHRPATATVGATTFTYAPDLSPVAELHHRFGEDVPSDFIADGDDDPVQIEWVSRADVRNAFPIEYLDRENETTDGEWPPATVQVEEVVDANESGLQVADVTTAHHYTTKARAKWYSAFLAVRSVYICRRFRFRLTLGASWLLESGDLVSLTDLRVLVGVTVRIVDIEEADDTGAMDVTAEDVPW
jgi:hypothetical protein